MLYSVNFFQKKKFLRLFNKGLKFLPYLYIKLVSALFSFVNVSYCILVTSQEKFHAYWSQKLKILAAKSQKFKVLKKFWQHFLKNYRYQAKRVLPRVFYTTIGKTTSCSLGPVRRSDELESNLFGHNLGLFPYP